MESWPDVEHFREERKRSSANPLSRLECKKFKVLTGGYDGNICLLLVTDMEERVIARHLVLFIVLHCLSFQTTQHLAFDWNEMLIKPPKSGLHEKVNACIKAMVYVCLFLVKKCAQGLPALRVSYMFLFAPGGIQEQK